MLQFSHPINSLLNILGEDAAKVKGDRKALPVTPRSEKKMAMGRGLQPRLNCNQRIVNYSYQANRGGQIGSRE